MGWPTLSVLLSYSLNKLELIAFIVSFLLALYLKPKKLSIAISAGVMSVGLALGDFLHGNVLSFLDVQEQVYYWYLVWALFSLVQAFIVIGVHWFIGVMFSDQVKLVFMTMAVNALLNILMFIDRNILALNFNGSPNFYSEDSWLLWNVYSIGINANLLFLALALFSRSELKGKYVWMFLLYCIVVALWCCRSNCFFLSVLHVGIYGKNTGEAPTENNR